MAKSELRGKRRFSSSIPSLLADLLSAIAEGIKSRSYIRITVDSGYTTGVWS
jgi:hypothetical protein